MPDALLYIRCPTCNGSTYYNPPNRVATGSPCPTCKETPGFAPSGIDFAKVHVWLDIERALADDPVMPKEKKEAILTGLQELIDKVRNKPPERTVGYKPEAWRQPH